MRLTCYPEYKNSGLEWLVSVPAHWEIKRGKTLFSCIDLRSKTGEEELLTVSSRYGVIPRKSASVTMFKAESYVGYKLCWPGDLVINSLWAWACGLGVSRHYGIISTAYGVYRPHANKVDSSFIHELVRSTPFHWELRVRSKGVWTSRLQLTDWAFLDAPFPVPPLIEQKSISRYLKYMDRRIRRCIRDKQKLIRLLEEKKQAIIHSAVTRGLDPNVRLKDSGIEWLGDIPAHWTVKPIKRAFATMEYGISESATDNGLIRVLTMGNIRNGGISVPTYGGVSTVDPELLLQPNDLLFNRTNSAELVGKVGIFKGSDTPVTFASYLVRMRLKQENNPDYLNSLLNDYSILSLARREAIPSLHQSNLNPTRYGRLQIALPPLDEQVSIVRYLTETTAALNCLIKCTYQEIEFIREYRTRLIADVVTGKLDVREASAHLPVEEEEPESTAEADELTDDAAEVDAESISEEAEG